MRFWGITGTNGKTTTTWIFAAFVDAASTPAAPRKCGYITTVEVFDGQDRSYTGYTTPPLKQLEEIYARMAANGCTDCVMEVSSHAIHQRRTGDTDFAGGAFTNLTEDHLDYHKTMEEYFRVKASFAARIGAAAGDGKRPYVVCQDGGAAAEMLAACRAFPGLEVIPAGERANGANYDLSALPLAGAYNRANVLTAAALAEAAGVPRDVIQRTIPTLKPRWGRLELVENPAVAARVYVDFAHTPDGLEKVLGAVRPLVAGGKLWVVFGAGGDRDPMKRPLMGAAAATLADKVVVTSDNPRSEEPAKIIEAIVAGVPAARREAVVAVEPDRLKAIEFALRHAAKGDIVVIAGKGHETDQEIKGVKHHFDDREVVREFK